MSVAARRSVSDRKGRDLRPVLRRPARQNRSMSEVQLVTPELRQWIIDQASAGQQPEAVLKSMLASGWREDVAIQALEDTLRDFLAQRAKEAELPPPVPVPEPLRDSAGLPATVNAGDREVRARLASLAERRVEERRRSLATAGVDHVPILTGQDYAVPLRRAFALRARRIHR